MLSAFIVKNDLPKSFIDVATTFYIPLANKLFCEQQVYSNSKNVDKSPMFVGLNGCQGSGKTTLSKFLAQYLQHQFNLSVAVLSLDDFYLSKAKRQLLAETVHPLFQTRGVPGTHDTDLLKSVLLGLKNINKSNVSIDTPCFDKAQDNVSFPFNKVSGKIDIVVFEGWCWGVSAQHEEALIMPINKLEKIKDNKAVWRNKVNELLRHNYQPLYDLMNIWLMLKAPSFDVVYQWRLEQEEKLRKVIDKAKDSDGLMDCSQINEFIQFFQRLTDHGLRELPKKVDILLELDHNREIIASRGLK